MAELPRIVAQRLAMKVVDQAGSHPDPNVLTAFVENLLPSSERQGIVQHLSECRGCRGVVLLSLPEHAELVSRSQSSASSMFSRPVVRWAALAACLVVVGAAVILRHEYSSKPLQVASIQTAQVREPELNTKIPPAAPAPTANAASGEAASADRDKLSPPAGANALRLERGRSEVAKKSAAPISTKEKSLKSDDEAKEVAALEQPASPAPNSNLDELVPGRAKDAGGASASANQMAPVSGVMANTPSRSARMSMSKVAVPAVRLLPRWTLTTDGTLQRSYDSGTTWETIPVGGPAKFRALAANGLDIWVGGASGTLFHSADAGQHWTQVRPTANGEPLTADITGVEFTDLQHGTLSTSAQETWITSDAGLTWQKK